MSGGNKSHQDSTWHAICASLLQLPSYTIYIRIIAGTKGRGFASTLGNQPNQPLQIGVLYGIMVIYGIPLEFNPSVSKR